MKSIKPTDFYIKQSCGGIRKFFSQFVSVLMPTKILRNRVRNIIRFGVWRTLRATLRAKKETFPHYLCIAAVARDEGRYFKEWIDYHRLVGVEKFFIFDNQSTDNTREVLQPYIDAGIVEYHYVEGDGIQNQVNYFAVSHARDKTKWLAVIDLDEFIMPIADKTIPEFLHRFSPRTAQIFLRWCLYGSSGHIKRPEGLVIENYKYRKRDNSDEANKIIVNPRLICGCGSAHAFDAAGRSVDESNRTVAPSPVIPGCSQNLIRINHYRCKSFQDSQEKHNKGDVLYGRDYVRYTKADFDRFDTNDVYDDAMDKYVAKIKKCDTIAPVKRG